MTNNMLDSTKYPYNIEELVSLIWNWYDEKNLDDPIMQYAKVNEEIGEIGHELTRERYDSKEIVDAIGDSMITLIGLCHHLKISPMECLSTAYEEIKDRKGTTRNGTFIKDYSEQENLEHKLIKKIWDDYKEASDSIYHQHYQCDILDFADYIKEKYK